MKKILLTFAAAVAVLSGCNKTMVETSGREGVLRLNVACDEAEFTEKEYGALGTKASAAPDVNDFIISIVKSTGSYSLESTVSDFLAQNADGIITLSPGVYTVSVTSGSTEKAAWDQPIYGATKEFTIVEDVVTPIDLVCRLTNMKVTVKLSDVFLQELKSWSVVVTGAYDDGDASLTWSSGDGDQTAIEAKEGWFAVGPLTVVVQGVRNNDGSDAARVTAEITDVAAADHHILNINAKVNGSADFSDGGITVDTGVNEKPVDIEIPGFDETPIEDPDDPDEPVSTAPTLVWDDNPAFDKTLIKEGMDVNLVVNAPEKIKGFNVNVNSPTLNSLLEQLVGTSQMDLVNNAAVIGFLGNLGLPVGEQLSGQTEVVFSLSSLVPMILITTPEPGSEHVFTLVVTDEKNQTLEQDLVFYVPETASSAE